ncbi:hypothetical protein ACWERI_33830 [Streptomyces collinus]|uniref:hypothetical protein n=1 Tax=Streptomyces collinus TaxID=42684 RepID=UPI0036A8ECF7
MDSAELVSRLREAGVPEAYYEITGVHEVPVRPDAHYVMRHEAGVWTVGVRQRSQDGATRRFGTEAEACAYLYAKLTALPPPPSGAAHPLEELLADPEEIQRQAWRDFERAARADPEEDPDR